MLFTDCKSVSSTYKVIYHRYASIGSVFSTYRVLYHIYMLFTASFWSVCSTYRVLYGIYMLFTASFGSVCSTYRVILFYYIYFLQPLLGLPLAHIELIIHIYRYMPFTDLKSASSTYVLDFYGMPLLKFLGHTNYLC